MKLIRSFTAAYLLLAAIFAKLAFAETPAIIPADSAIVTGWEDLLLDVRSKEQWQHKSRLLRQEFLQLVHDDQRPQRPPLDLKIHESMDVDGVYLRQLISYQVEENERAWAYLAIPHEREERSAAIIALHGTGVEGKDIVAGFVDRHGHEGTGHLDFLARRGYIVLAPDLFNMGQRLPAGKTYDTAEFYRKHPQWTALGKIVHDGAAGIEVLLQRPDVDPQRLGAIGHSLGGMGTIYLAAYDERIRAAVCIHGSVTFRFNTQVTNLSRPSGRGSYVFFPALRDQLLQGKLPPIDTHEILALIAPRAFLDVVSVNDAYNGGPATHRRRVLMDLKLTELYALCGAPQNFAFFVIGQQHAYEHDTRELACAWLDKHLAMARAAQPPALQK